jgi:hypothetical protein
MSEIINPNTVNIVILMPWLSLVLLRVSSVIGVSHASVNLEPMTIYSK